jgi:hypothetical protein
MERDDPHPCVSTCGACIETSIDEGRDHPSARDTEPTKERIVTILDVTPIGS